MKLLATADLHYGLSPEGKECARRLAQEVCCSDAEALLIGGDVGERSMESLCECLELFGDFDGWKMFVPGNHDLWIRTITWDNYRGAFSRVGGEHGFHLLDAEPLVCGKLAFIGNIGWFDMTFSSESVEGEAFAKWARGHRQITERCVSRLRRQYEELPNQVDTVVCLLHHVPFRELATAPGHSDTGVEAGGVGSSRFGDLLLELKNVDYVICGHLHDHMVLRKGALTAFLVGGTSYDELQLFSLDTCTGEHGSRHFRSR
jgi:predicted phosphohydrolase